MKLTFIILLLVTCTLAASFTPEQLAKLDPVSKECRKESGMTEEDVNKGRAEGFENNPKTQKQAFCILKKTGIISESGDMDSDVVKGKLRKVGVSEEKITKVLKCVVKQGTPEAKAFALGECIHNEVENFSPTD